MKRALKILGYVAGVVLALAVVAAVYVYVASERILDRTYDVPAVAVALPTDSTSIAEGRRLATTRGCYAGCHGPQAEGLLFFDEPAVARMVAPNLTRAVRVYSDAELARVIRHGVRRDGRSVLAMPSPMFSGLTDQDLGRIVAFLRSQPEREGPADLFEIGPLGRLGIATGEFPPLAETIDHDAPPAAAPAPGDTLAIGRYLAQTLCTECHGDDLQGTPADGTPALAAVAAYPAADFTRLMRTGVPAGGRTLNLMAEVARSRFVHLTGDEVAALHAYLRTLPASGA